MKNSIKQNSTTNARTFLVEIAALFEVLGLVEVSKCKHIFHLKTKETIKIKTFNLFFEYHALTLLVSESGKYFCLVQIREFFMLAIRIKIKK